MKVQEKGSDRKAEVHLHAQAMVDELDEFGEYVDPVDKAICCYVPVEDGTTIKIGGRFWGTTLTVAYDCSVDGVLRKAQHYASKSTAYQKAKKLDFETFLYQIDDGILETDMKAAMWSASNTSTLKTVQSDGPETVGTVELRVFVLRSFGDELSIGDVQTYYNHEGSEDDSLNGATYKTIPQDITMSFEKNCATLDKAAVGRQKSKMDKKRPGREPWAIFRFHYRHRESIESRKLEKTHDSGHKSKSKLRMLDLEPVPELQVGAKPDKTQQSTRTSTPNLSSVPNTPTKSTREASSPLLKKSSLKLAALALKDILNSPTPSPSPGFARGRTCDDEEGNSTTPTKQTVDQVTGFAPSETTTERGQAQEKLTVNNASSVVEQLDISQGAAEDQAQGATATSENAAKLGNDNAAEHVNKDATTTATKPIDLAPEPAQNYHESIQIVTQSAGAAKPTILPAPKKAPKKAPKIPLPAAKPANTTTLTAKPSKTPAKRPSPLKLSEANLPSSKRPKPSPFTPPAPPTPPSLPTSPPSPPKTTMTTTMTTKTPSLYSTRKQLALAKQQREQLRQRRAEVDDQLAVYKAQMHAEMEKLDKELEEEKRLLAEEMQSLKEDASLLSEFQKRSEGV